MIAYLFNLIISSQHFGEKEQFWGFIVGISVVHDFIIGVMIGVSREYKGVHHPSSM
jgi:hypothetical protein